MKSKLSDETIEYNILLCEDAIRQLSRPHPFDLILDGTKESYKDYQEYSGEEGTYYDIETGKYEYGTYYYNYGYAYPDGRNPGIEIFQNNLNHYLDLKAQNQKRNLSLMKKLSDLLHESLDNNKKLTR